VEVAYTKGLVPTRCFLNTTAPVLRLEYPADRIPAGESRL